MKFCIYLCIHMYITATYSGLQESAIFGEMNSNSPLATELLDFPWPRAEFQAAARL